MGMLKNSKVFENDLLKEAEEEDEKEKEEGFLEETSRKFDELFKIRTL